MKSIKYPSLLIGALIAMLLASTASMATTRYTVTCFYNDGTYWSGQTTDYGVMMGMLSHCRSDGGRGANITYVNT